MNGEPHAPASRKPHRPGRPARGGNHAVRAEPTEPALNRLLEQLLADNMWLREKPESEGFIAEKTHIPKSSVREAAIALIKIGCLKRTPDGLLRDTLNADRLIPLYAQRLRIELLAFRQIFDLKHVKRQTIAENIQMYWRRQMDANTNDEKKGLPPGRKNADSSGASVNTDFMRWLHAGMDFHTTLVRSADMIDEANLLFNLMVQMRVGSFKKVDELTTRDRATRQHLTYLQLVSDGPTLKELSEPWHKFVANHVEASFYAALATAEDTTLDGASDIRKARMWTEVIERATCDPRILPSGDGR